MRTFGTCFWPNLTTAVRYELGQLNESLYQSQLGSSSFDPPPDLPGARSISIVAVPTPQVRLIVHWHGKRLPVIITPTYVRYSATTEGVQTSLAERSAADWRSTGVTTSAMSPVWAASLQLVAAFSDLPCDEDPWRNRKALERCDSSVACVEGCPTGAIAGARFMICAERCLTYHNEAEGDLPAWIDPAWHHGLIGCLRCQAVCPENEAVRTWVEDRGEFSEREVSMLLRHEPFDRLPDDPCGLGHPDARCAGVKMSGSPLPPHSDDSVGR